MSATVGHVYHCRYEVYAWSVECHCSLSGPFAHVYFVAALLGLACVVDWDTIAWCGSVGVEQIFG
ncbi:hypothetical protein XF_1317 [Xylella fastidiosa 9a5c]|uniref:Uncharacterized protein n=1 Tax=Xylella fastidiosa (strain 9a5c) TaxID=160492 RepID=Q9PDR2_XYLFA|nr:hypothetical protein XF_1317 [Xylella fastidiosa 9a5c]